MTKTPPVPPDEARPFESEHPKSEEKDRGSKKHRIPGNLQEEDRQGNIYQNTHNQGYQQDR